MIIIAVMTLIKGDDIVGDDNYSGNGTDKIGGDGDGSALRCLTHASIPVAVVDEHAEVLNEGGVGVPREIWPVK